MAGRKDSIKEGRELENIGLRMQRNQVVNLQNQLQFLRYRETSLSKQLQGGDGDAYHPLESVRAQIESVIRKIQNSGRRGGGTTGEGTRRASRNTPQPR